MACLVDPFPLLRPEEVAPLANEFEGVETDLAEERVVQAHLLQDQVLLDHVARLNALVELVDHLLHFVVVFLRVVLKRPVKRFSQRPIALHVSVHPMALRVSWRRFLVAFKQKALPHILGVLEVAQIVKGSHRASCSRRVLGLQLEIITLRRLVFKSHSCVLV